MTPDALLIDFALPLVLGGQPALDLPLSDTDFDAICAAPPPDLPALADALTLGSRCVWAATPPARIDADVVYTLAMLHDLLGALHPIFVESRIARFMGAQIQRRLARRRRPLDQPLVAVRRHVLAQAALRAVRVDEHVDLHGLGRISGLGQSAQFAALPWRVEAARSHTEVTAPAALAGERWVILEALSPLTAFAVAARDGRALPWIRWLASVPALLRFMVHTLATSPNGPTALLATVEALAGRQSEDARWWLGLTLVVAGRTRHGDESFRALVDALSPFATVLGAPPSRRRARGPHPDSVRMALAVARLET